MNEHIEELAAQLGEPSTWGAERPVGPGFAGSRWSGWSDIQQELRGYNTPLYDTAQLEKFAELIVQDCLEQMAQGDLDFAIWKIKKDYNVK
jgi:hypothetical protein